jgi:hypothetical protein
LSSGSRENLGKIFHAVLLYEIIKRI